MSASPYIYEVTQRDFDARVLAKSREVPVLVDFWAAWCGPCQMLMPLLARLAEEYQGKFLLAKVNTDVEQGLAAQYGIRSLPTVRLFRNGEPVDGFLGVQSEKTIRTLLDRYVARASDAALAAALAARRSGDNDRALALLRQAVQADPANERAQFALAQVLVDAGTEVSPLPPATIQRVTR